MSGSSVRQKVVELCNEEFWGKGEQLATSLRC